MDTEMLTCPITGERMKDPVVDPEGNTYEREAILNWLSRQHTSPITRSPLQPQDLVPNRALAQLLNSCAPQSGSQTSAGSSAPADASAVSNRLSAINFQEPPPPPPFQPEIKAVHTTDGTVHIKLNMSSSSTDCTHAPSTIICVIDISYSMDSRATMPGDEEGSSGLSLLDIVKHATHTIIETLEPHDMLGVVVGLPDEVLLICFPTFPSQMRGCIVHVHRPDVLENAIGNGCNAQAYATKANLVCPIRSMTPENRANAWRLVQELKTDGQTNLWDGLRMALEMAKAAVSQNCSIMLLTDGLPNIEPPRGHCPTLKRYLAEAPDLHCEISTFGFGYNLESALLRDIAALGRGSYAFIPDSGFVGTCFVNAAANVLSTAAAAATLEVKPLNGAQLVGPLVEVKCNGNQDGMTIALPFLQYGQSKDILMRVSLGPDSSLPQVSVALCIGGSSYTAESSFCQPSSPEAAELHSHHARLLLVNMLEEAEDKLAKAGNETSEQHKALESAQASIAQLVAGIAGPQNQGGSQLVQGMLEDLTGQVTEAYSRLDWHKKWGIHYVPSLARAHVLQICTNFKDAGLQSYAGAKFCTIRDRAEAIFINLPAPTPSLSRQTVGPVSMSRYHDSNNPCFAAGKVRMADGTVKDVAEVLPGDQVATPCNGVATVACIVATRCNNGVADLVRLPGGVLVTPYHPVQSLLTKNSEWRFPCDLMEGQMCTVSCGRVYSFVLSPPCAGAMVIGQYGCVTLGHGMKGPVVGHPYLGTQAVLDDLSVMHGWAQGLVLLEPGPAVRHPTTCMIEGLRQEQGAEEQDMHDLRSVVVLEKPLLPLAACQG